MMPPRVLASGPKPCGGKKTMNPMGARRMLDKDNYFDGVCLFHLPALEHFSRLLKSCVVLFQLLFSHISIKELCRSGVVLSRLSFLRRFSHS